jgi:hypothetical protein
VSWLLGSVKTTTRLRPVGRYVGSPQEAEMGEEIEAMNGCVTSAATNLHVKFRRYSR